MAYPVPVPMLPHGYTFMPTDEELVVQYLRPRAMNERVPCAIIVDVEILRYNPWDLLPEGCQEKYFYTQKELKYNKFSARRNRFTSEGYWRATGPEIPIHSRGELVGMKRSLVFYRGHAPDSKLSEWAMQEFRLAGAGLGPFPVIRPVGSENQGLHCRSGATDIANKLHDYGFVNCVHKKDDAPTVALLPANSHDAHPVMVSPDESWVICRVYKRRSRVRRAIVPAVNACGNGAQYIDFMGEANRELSPAVSSTTDTVSYKKEDNASDNKKSGNSNGN